MWSYILKDHSKLRKDNEKLQKQIFYIHVYRNTHTHICIYCISKIDGENPINSQVCGLNYCLGVMETFKHFQEYKDSECMTSNYPLWKKHSGQLKKKINNSMPGNMIEENWWRTTTPLKYEYKAITVIGTPQENVQVLIERIGILGMLSGKKKERKELTKFQVVVVVLCHIRDNIKFYPY